MVSSDFGQKVIDLSTDHKPNYEDEEKRIISLGGKIY